MNPEPAADGYTPVVHVAGPVRPVKGALTEREQACVRCGFILVPAIPPYRPWPEGGHIEQTPMTMQFGGEARGVGWSYTVVEDAPTCVDRRA